MAARLLDRRLLWPTLIAVPLMAVAVALGLWQLERLEWKEALIARLAERLHAAPRPLPPALLDSAEFEFLPVRLRGEYLHGRETPILSRTFEGAVGHDLVTPFRAGDGRVVLVNRGWIPLGAADRVERPKGVVEVVGHLRRPSEVNPFSPANDPGRGKWYRVDPRAMGEALGLPVEPLYVDAAEDGPGGLPKARLTRLVLPNNHLQYALTWFALAAALAAIYALYARRTVRDGEG